MRLSQEREAEIRELLNAVGGDGYGYELLAEIDALRADLNFFQSVSLKTTILNEHLIKERDILEKATNAIIKAGDSVLQERDKYKAALEEILKSKVGYPIVKHFQKLATKALEVTKERV